MFPRPTAAPTAAPPSAPRMPLDGNPSAREKVRPAVSGDFKKAKTRDVPGLWEAIGIRTPQIPVGEDEFFTILKGRATGVQPLLPGAAHLPLARVDELHLESGWVPKATRVEEFESAIRTVCEPIFEKPLAEYLGASLGGAAVRVRVIDADSADRALGYRELDFLLTALLQQLFPAANVAQCPNRIRGTARHDVRRATIRPNFLRDFIHRCVEVGALGILTKIRAEDTVKEYVT